jgi:hypothetical protein
MTKRECLRLFGVYCNRLGWGGGACVLAALAVVAFLLFGCAASHGTQSMFPDAPAPPVVNGAETRPAPLMGPPDPADDTRLLGQQVGALNLQLQSVVKNTLAEFRSFLEHLEVRLTAKVEAQVQASVTGAVVNTKQDLTWKAVALVLGLMLIGTAFVAFFVLRLVRALQLSAPVAVFGGPRKGVPP